MLDCLEDWLGNIDMSCNFHKIGGLPALEKCLASEEPSLRSGAAHLLGELAQNNPYCQDRLLEEGFLQLLLSQLDDDSSPLAQVKALYALSCLCRDNLAGLSKLGALGGWQVLVRALQREEPRLTTKGCFLLASAAEVDPSVLEEMVSMGVVLQLAAILEGEDRLEHEHVVRALVVVVAGSRRGREEARGVAGLVASLEARLGGREEEGEESREHCRKVLELLGQEEGVDR